MSRRAWIGTVGFEMLALAVSGMASDWNWVVVGVVFVLAGLFAWLIFPEGQKRVIEPKGPERMRPAFVRGDASGSSFTRLTPTGPTTWSMGTRGMRCSPMSPSGWDAPGAGSGAGSDAGSIGTTGDLRAHLRVRLRGVWQRD